jgi:HEPN superfamily AbiU2-like protein
LRYARPIRAPGVIESSPPARLDMVDPAIEFEKEVEILRTEASAATQFFYAYLAILTVSNENESVRRLLNNAPLFWNTALGAFQTAAFIVLGRIFDQRSPHNIDQVLRIAQKHQNIFSKAALGKRKQGKETIPPDWLPEYLREAYVPKVDDFRRLRAYVRKHRKTYESKYRDLRHKIFAHKEVTEPAAVSALFARTNIRELQRLFVFPSSLHEALWQLFFNGQRPALRARRYSLKRMRDLPSPASRQEDVQERISREIDEFLVTAANAADRAMQSDTDQRA